MGTGLELRTSERIASTLNYSVIYPGPVLCFGSIQRTREI